MSTTREVTAIAKKQLAQRDAFWPSAEAWIWNRKAHKGFATIPKTMPLIPNIMDDMSNGKPLSSTYLGLWCGTWDNSFIIVSKSAEMAHAAGFSGQRAEYTWTTRMKLLQELKFIDFQPGKSGAITYVIIWNPHYIIGYHHAQKTPGLTAATYNALIDRALEVGAKDMLDGPPAPPAPAVTPTPAPPSVTPIATPPPPADAAADL